MFQKLDTTQYPPADKPIMIWDGNCGFCKYWITRWSKLTGDKVTYEPYQSVSDQFPDIDIIHFKQASRLVETSGKIFSGPRSAFRTLTYASRWTFFDRWYENKAWFATICDRGYSWIEKNRSILFKLTKALFGSDPNEIRPFWAIYLALIGYAVYWTIRG